MAGESISGSPVVGLGPESLWVHPRRLVLNASYWQKPVSSKPDWPLSSTRQTLSSTERRIRREDDRPLLVAGRIIVCHSNSAWHIEGTFYRYCLGVMSYFLTLYPKMRSVVFRALAALLMFPRLVLRASMSNSFSYLSTASVKD
jgi:hypothetical protein